jgi:hypothetical protein
MVAAGLSVIFSITNAYAGLCDEYFSAEYYTSCEKGVDEIISKDARGWWVNRYDQGSARLRRDDTRASFSSSGVNLTLTVDYTYNGGMKGWVEIEIVGGVVKCLRYHDFQNTCRSHYK